MAILRGLAIAFILVVLGFTFKSFEDTHQKLLTASDFVDISGDFATISVILDKNTGNDDILDELDYLKRKGSVQDYAIESLDETHKNIKLHLDSPLEYNLTTDNKLIPIQNSSFSGPDSTLHKEMEFYISLCLNLSCENSDSYEMLSEKLDSLKEVATKNDISFSYKYIPLSDHKELEYTLSGDLHRKYLSSKIK